SSASPKPPRAKRDRVPSSARPEKKSSDYAPAHAQSPIAAASRPIKSSSARPATSSDRLSPVTRRWIPCAASPERHTAWRKYSDSLPPSNPGRWSAPAESRQSPAAPPPDREPHHAPQLAPPPP